MSDVLMPFGANDLLAFWSGVQAFLDGANPYDPAVLQRYQQSALPEVTTPQSFLNPPWTLPLLSLFFWPGFETVRVLWIALNIFFLGGTALLSVRLALSGTTSRRADSTLSSNPQMPGAISHESVQALMLACCFLPAFLCLYLGQLSLAVAFSLALGAYALMRGQHLLAGFAFIPLLLKPHLVLPLGIALAIYCFGTTGRGGISLTRNLRTPLAFLAGFVALTATALIKSPELFRMWNGLEFDLLNYRTATLATAIRDAWYLTFDALPAGPIYLLPAIGIGVVILHAKRLNELFSVERKSTNFAALIALSLVFAPYAWTYDFSLLLISQTILVMRSRSTLWFMLALQFALLMTSHFSGNMASDLWFPIAVMLML